MRIGICGMGKVGLPVALALAVHGKHQVTGYDVSTFPMRILQGRAEPPMEAGIRELLAADHGIELADSPAALVKASDLVIVCVPTPHPPGYGGETPVSPGDAMDFVYHYLVRAVREICRAAQEQRKKITVSVLSTVLPGTMRREILPLGNEFTAIVYAPAFISLGSTVSDFTYAPFALCGIRQEGDGVLLHEAYRALPYEGIPLYQMSIESAEVAKMAYNFYGTVRIELANMIMQLCQATGADCDQVSEILDFANEPVRSGMPDGGPCRPRDLLALSWLARETGAFSLPSDIILARQFHARWLADQVRNLAAERELPVVLCGTAYKPGSDLTAGSPSLLLAHYLGNCLPWEPADGAPPGPAVLVAAVRGVLKGQAGKIPAGSVVFDPWGTLMAYGADIEIIRPGRT